MSTSPQALSTVATAAGGMLALKMRARALLRRYSQIVSVPATKPPIEANDFEKVPVIRPKNSLIVLRWNQGGRKVCSATAQRGGKITKSTLAVPG